MRANKLVLPSANITGFLKAVSLEREVYAPVRVAGGEALYAKVKEDSDFAHVSLASSRPVLSAKVIFFPQFEQMFEFSDGKLEERLSRSPKLLFGILSCDLAGLTFSDDFYRRNHEDAYYLARREDTLTVVIGCNRPPDRHCMCTSTRTGPFADSGFDLQLVALGERFLVEVGSDQGERLLRAQQSFFAPATEEDMSLAAAAKSKALKAMEPNLDFGKATERLRSGEIPPSFWDDVAARCITCGGCLYVCPTCTCFNVFDHGNEEKGNRCRNWDACIFAGYTREASGHNPREDKKVRTARRYEHKLLHDVTVAGRWGCVGCGRCSFSCPVELNFGLAVRMLTGTG